MEEIDFIDVCKNSIMGEMLLKVPQDDDHRDDVAQAIRYKEMANMFGHLS